MTGPATRDSSHLQVHPVLCSTLSLPLFPRLQSRESFSLLHSVLNSQFHGPVPLVQSLCAAYDGLQVVRATSSGVAGSLVRGTFFPWDERGHSWAPFTCAWELLPSSWWWRRQATGGQHFQIPFPTPRLPQRKNVGCGINMTAERGTSVSVVTITQMAAVTSRLHYPIPPKKSPREYWLSDRSKGLDV